MKKADIDGCIVSLEADERQLLFILLAQDGSINRCGSGSLSETDRDMYIGVTDEALFGQLVERVDEGWLANGGRFEARDREGTDCTLSVMFRSLDGSEVGIQFVYGSESMGPPDDIAEFVRTAVTITQPWFEAQQRMVGKSVERE